MALLLARPVFSLVAAPQRSLPLTVARANKRAKRPDPEKVWAARKFEDEQRALRRKGRATDMLPAELAVAGLPRLVEDHRHEQFFYNAATSATMLRLVERFERPLLLCNPSIAAR